MSKKWGLLRALCIPTLEGDLIAKHYISTDQSNGLTVSVVSIQIYHPFSGRAKFILLYMFIHEVEEIICVCVCVCVCVFLKKRQSLI